MARRLESALTTRSLGRSAAVVSQAPSSQDMALALADAGAPEGQLVWALEQTAGRGRQGRSWVSGQGAGLWLSVILRPPLDLERAAFLSIVAAVAAGAWLDGLGVAARLKWPNDVVVDGHKLAGILGESVGGRAASLVILGVGVNLTTPVLADPAAPHPTSLTDLGIEAGDQPRLVAGLLGSLEDRYQEFLRDGPPPAQLRWLEMSDSIGRRVRAEMGAEFVEGLAVDLDPDGSLVIETAGGLRRVRSGEVHHLR